MRNRARLDDNQGRIVKQLRLIGVSVQSMASIGKGCPDLLLGFKGKNYLVELKDGAKFESQKRLTPDEQQWFDKWRGQVIKCENIDEILKLIN